MTGRLRRSRQKQATQEQFNLQDDTPPLKVTVNVDTLINAVVGGAITGIVTLATRQLILGGADGS